MACAPGTQEHRTKTMSDRQVFMVSGPGPYGASRNDTISEKLAGSVSTGRADVDRQHLQALGTSAPFCSMPSNPRPFERIPFDLMPASAGAAAAIAAMIRVFNMGGLLFFVSPRCRGKRFLVSSVSRRAAATGDTDDTKHAARRHISDTKAA
jgi:hypothetical protein